MSQELQQYTGLLDIQTGEILPATVGNAARVISAARAMKQHVNEIVREATAYLVDESTRRGIRTLHDDQETVTITGGPTVDYDPMVLMANLEEVDCPPDRIAAAITTEVTYKVNRAVLKQLASANPDYATAIELAEREVERDYRATIKLRRQTDAE